MQMSANYLKRLWALVSNMPIKNNGEMFRTKRSLYVIASIYFFLASFASISVIDIYPDRSAIIMASAMLFAMLLAIPELSKFYPVAGRASASAVNYIMLFLIIGGVMLVAKYI